MKTTFLALAIVLTSFSGVAQGKALYGNDPLHLVFSTRFLSPRPISLMRVSPFRKACFPISPLKFMAALVRRRCHCSLPGSVRK